MIWLLATTTRGRLPDLTRDQRALFFYFEFVREYGIITTRLKEIETKKPNKIC